jgi:hypothetical protein
MAWIYLFIAGIVETGCAMGLKYSEEFTRLWSTLVMVAAGALGFYLLFVSMKSLPGGGSIRGLDRHRGGRDGGSGHPVPQRAA